MGLGTKKIMSNLISKSNNSYYKKNFFNKKKILVTGHTGFKGSWLTLWLMMKGAQVYGYALPPKKNQPLFNEFFYQQKSSEYLEGELNHNIGDINDFDKLSKYVSKVKPDLIFHLAAQPLVQRSYKCPIETWNTNVIGSLNLLESLKGLQNQCAVVFITTDKVYENKEWIFGYRENDALGGEDPYSSSKAAMELAIKSWRSSFCGSLPHQTSRISIATARAGNVIGGGDWAQNRIIPDVINSLKENKPVLLRNPSAKRPWQHVLEPLAGYLILGRNLLEFQIKKGNKNNPFASAFNFGPKVNSNKSVLELVENLLNFWPGTWQDISDPKMPNEANLLNLVSDKSYQLLEWEPKWNFDETSKITMEWYLRTFNGESPLECAINDIKKYQLDI